MLPSLTSLPRPRPRRPLLLAVSGALLVGGAALATRDAIPTPAAAAPSSIAERLAPSTWAIAVPTAWLAAPLVGLRQGDRLDMLAIRPGERATATAIAFDLEVMSVDDRTVVLGASAADVTALAGARASGQLIVPLLRSTR